MIKVIKTSWFYPYYGTDNLSFFFFSLPKSNIECLTHSVGIITWIIGIHSRSPDSFKITAVCRAINVMDGLLQQRAAAPPRMERPLCVPTGAHFLNILPVFPTGAGMESLVHSYLRIACYFPITTDQFNCLKGKESRRRLMICEGVKMCTQPSSLPSLSRFCHLEPEAKILLPKKPQVDRIKQSCTRNLKFLSVLFFRNKYLHQRPYEIKARS